MKMKANKIKVWARIGEITFWLYQFFFAAYRLQYEEFESAGTTAEVLSWICLVILFIFSEAIVRLICYFADLLEDKKQ